MKECVNNAKAEAHERLDQQGVGGGSLDFMFDTFGACSIAEASLADINSRDSLLARVAGARGYFERPQCF